jgi:hypothetical protein
MVSNKRQFESSKVVNWLDDADKYFRDVFFSKSEMLKLQFNIKAIF